MRSALTDFVLGDTLAGGAIADEPFVQAADLLAPLARIVDTFAVPALLPLRTTTVVVAQAVRDRPDVDTPAGRGVAFEAVILEAFLLARHARVVPGDAGVGGIVGGAGGVADLGGVAEGLARLAATLDAALPPVAGRPVVAVRRLRTRAAFFAGALVGLAVAVVVQGVAQLVGAGEDARVQRCAILFVFDSIVVVVRVLSVGDPVLVRVAATQILWPATAAGGGQGDKAQEGDDRQCS
jgi:hypothetical protein